ncbi:MAG TPA: hypothetical protein VF754_06985 [Pyrinomonadaceae bacterium]
MRANLLRDRCDERRTGLGLLQLHLDIEHLHASAEEGADFPERRDVLARKLRAREGGEFAIEPCAGVRVAKLCRGERGD